MESTPELTVAVLHGHCAGGGCVIALACYAGGGPRCQPDDPRMMVKVLLYACCKGICSSRKIARSLEDRIAFRFLAADSFPSHRTICRLRRENLRSKESFRTVCWLAFSGSTRVL